MMVIPSRGRVVAVLSALALAGGLLTLVLAKHTQAETPTDNEKQKGAVVEEFPIAFTLDTTQCVGGELIDITGTLHTVTHFVPVKGGYHTISQFNFVNGRGVGQTTGDEYVISARSKTVENFLPTGDTVTGDVLIETDIGKGSSPDRVLFGTFRYILTEDGVVEAAVEQFFVKCSGGETASPTATA